MAIKLGLEGAPPLRLAWLRFLVGGVVILAWGWVTGRLAGFTIAPAERRPLAGLGLLFAAQIGTMNVGTALTSAAHAAILLNGYAVHVVVLAHFLIPGDRFTARRFGGVLVAYAGIALLLARQDGAFHEDVTNRILDDLVAAARPRWAEVVGDFNVRGGIETEVRAAYGKRPEV